MVSEIKFYPTTNDDTPEFHKDYIDSFIGCEVSQKFYIKKTNHNESEDKDLTLYIDTKNAKTLNTAFQALNKYIPQSTEHVLSVISELRFNTIVDKNEYFATKYYVPALINLLQNIEKFDKGYKLRIRIYSNDNGDDKLSAEQDWSTRYSILQKIKESLKKDTFTFSSPEDDYNKFYFDIEKIN